MILFALCVLMFYLAFYLSDSRQKSYYFGYVLSTTEYPGKFYHYYICKVKLESGQIVEVRCNPDLIKKDQVKVRLVRLQTIGNRFTYSIIYF
jgi:hypothetical protein